jgi:RNA ligase (TIGR02306 family)
VDECGEVVTDFHVEVVRIGAIEKHENADSLGIVRVGDYPVVVRLGEFKPGDLAVYVPTDSVVPSTEDERWSFLGGHRRIRAKKLRGVFSQGLLTKAEPDMREGDDVAELMGITRYEPPMPGQSLGPHESSYDGDEPDPGIMPKYTDIENLRRYPNILQPGEPVVVTEKIHGENARFVYADGRLWVGSRTRIKRPGIGAWWRAAQLLELEKKLAAFPRVAFYGECHGYTGGFPYGSTPGIPQLKFFDVYDCMAGRYVDYRDALILIQQAGLDWVPPLAIEMPYDKEAVMAMAEGKSTLDDLHVREGVVVRPMKERYHDRLGRVILKLHGQGFLLRKEN